MPTSTKAQTQLPPLMKTAGQAPNKETTKITAPSFARSVDFDVTGLGERVGFACTGLAP